MGNETLVLSSISSSLAAVAQIGALRGDVVILRASGDWVPAKEGDPIYESDIVATAANAAALIYSEQNDILTLGHSAKLQFSPDFNESIAQNYQYASLNLGEKLGSDELINIFRAYGNIEEQFPAPSAGSELPSNPIGPSSPLLTIPEEYRSVYGEGQLTIWQRTDAEVIPVGGYRVGGQQELESFFSSLQEGSDDNTFASVQTEPVFVNTSANSSSRTNSTANSAAEQAIQEKITAGDDSLSIDEDAGAIAGSVATNDSSDQSGSLTYRLLSSASHGELSFAADGTYTYTPDSNFHGTDTFVYEVQGSHGGVTQATATITVDAVIDLSSSEGALNLTEDTGAAAGNVSGDNSTTSGGTLSYALAPDGNPANGTLVMNSDGSYSYTPDKNFSGDDSFQYVVTDSDSGESAVQTVSITVDPDVEIPAMSAVITENIPGLPNATGLLYQTYTGLPYPAARTADSTNAALQESQYLTGATPNTVTNQTTGFSDVTSIGGKSIHSVTGLIYLEAGTKYQFSGQIDDILRIELGGTTMMSTTGNSYGTFGPSGTSGTISGSPIDGGTFIPTEDGYYTLEVYAGNHGGSGDFRLDILVDDVEQSLSNDNLRLYSSASDIVSAGGRIDDFVAGTSGDGGHFPVSTSTSVSGVQDTSISISHLTVAPQGSDTVTSIVLEDIPVGAIVSDGSSSFTATVGSTSAEIFGWNLASLTITPPPGSTDTIDLTVNVTTESTTAQTTNTELEFSVAVVATDYADNVDPQVAGTLPTDTPLGNEIPASTGLLTQLYTGLSYPATRTADSANAALQESTILSGETPASITREINGYSDRVNVPHQGAYVITGLIYLEADSTYQFSGYIDDILRIELGGTIMMSTTGNSYGDFGPGGTDGTISGSHINGGSFTPTVDGYYTIEVYAGNHGGAGDLELNIWVDGKEYDLNAENFGLYASVDDLTSVGGSFDDFVAGADTADGGYFPYSASASTGDVGTADTDIAGAIDDADSDLVTGSAGNDILTAGGSGNVVLHGLDGNDEITGNANENLLAGGSGNDTLSADAGEDILRGGKGQDTMTGGTDADTFLWNVGDTDGSTDTITDFELGAGGDTINLADVLQNISTGAITDYLTVSYDAVSGDSKITVDANGTNGGVTEDLSIIIKSVDLTAIGGGTQSGILNQLVTDGNLIVET